MKKLILYIAESLDGFIAGPNHEMDWLFVDQDYGFNDFLAQIDTVLIGRKTYDFMKTAGEADGIKGQINYVFTSTPQKFQSTEKLIFTSEDPAELWKKIRTTEGKDAWLAGGGEIAKPLIEQNLIDEYFLFVHPIILGKGLPLFKEISDRVDLKTIDVKSYSSGLVQIHLERK